MLFNSLSFLVFFPVVYLAYLALPHRWQNRLLLVASYVFYGSWDWRFLFLILMSTGVDYVCGLRMWSTVDPVVRRRLLLLSLTTNLGLLGTFKYFDFFATSLTRVLSSVGLGVDAVTLDLILPVGISFYTFQTLSYTIDVYRRRVEPEKDLVDFALFVSFFPQLVAGPIERAGKLLPQLKRRRTLTRDGLLSGIWMVFWGYFLKLFMADNLATIVDDVFGRSVIPDGPTSLLALYAFAFQIFGDFAGYSFIALGIARLLGIELTTNFLFPYFVTSPREFWRHWHITLSTWLRDNLYIPLGGNRGSTNRVSRNLMTTMLLGGLWHGAGWTFVIWGAYQGLLLAAQRGAESLRLRMGHSALPGEGGGRRFLRIILMFQITCLGWLVFRAESMTQALGMLHSMLRRFGWPSENAVLMATNLVFYASLPMFVQWLQFRSGDVRTIDGLPAPLRVPIVLSMIYLLLVWGNYGGGEFIYFQF